MSVMITRLTEKVYTSEFYIKGNEKQTLNSNNVTKKYNTGKLLDHNGIENSDNVQIEDILFNQQ